MQKIGPFFLLAISFFFSDICKRKVGWQALPDAVPVGKRLDWMAAVMEFVLMCGSFVVLAH